MAMSTILTLLAGLAWYCESPGLAWFLAVLAVATWIKEIAADAARAAVRDRIEREEERAHLRYMDRRGTP